MNDEAPRHPRSTGGRRLVGRATVGWWVIATALYVSFTGWVWTQLVAGAVVATSAVAVTRMALEAAGPPPRRPVPRVWRGRAVASIVGRETGAVGAALWRQVRGVAPVEGRFVAFRVDEHIDAGTDTAITLEASLAPNTYVVAATEDDEGQVVLVHQFTPRPRPRETFPRWYP